MSRPLVCYTYVMPEIVYEMPHLGCGVLYALSVILKSYFLVYLLTIKRFYSALVTICMAFYVDV